MGRPMSEKKKAALEQIQVMKDQGFSIESIRSKLIEAGLTVAQVNDVCPLPGVAAEVPPILPPEPAQPLAQLVTEIAHFLEYAHKRFERCKPEQVGIRNDMLIWARKAKKAVQG